MTNNKIKIVIMIIIKYLYIDCFVHIINKIICVKTIFLGVIDYYHSAHKPEFPFFLPIRK